MAIGSDADSANIALRSTVMIYSHSDEHGGDLQLWVSAFGIKQRNVVLEKNSSNNICIGVLS